MGYKRHRQPLQVHDICNIDIGGYLLTPPSVGKTVIHMHVSINFAKQTYRTFESATAHCMHTHTPQLQLQFADDIFAQHCTAVERVNTRKSLQLSKVNIS